MRLGAGLRSWRMLKGAMHPSPPGKGCPLMPGGCQGAGKVPVDGDLDNFDTPLQAGSGAGMAWAWPEK